MAQLVGSNLFCKLGSACHWSDNDLVGIAMQIAIHAIGDRANDEVTALYQSLPARKASNGNSTDGNSSVVIRKHRIEHVQHLSGPQALEALREAGAVAVTNPLHLLSDLDIIEARLGKGRAKAGLAFPSKALLQVCITAVAPCQRAAKAFLMTVTSNSNIDGSDQNNA